MKFGHIWDNLQGDTTKYSQSILGWCWEKIDGTRPWYKWFIQWLFKRALYDPTNDVVWKKTFADALSDYLKDP